MTTATSSFATYWSAARTRIRSGIWVGCLAFIPTLGFALETTLTAPGAPEEVENRLRAASSSMSAETRGLDTPQELFAAAVSDYRTLVQVLYDDGYFSPVVHIRLDGREASSIKPINVPSSVNKIAITVTTGPAFKLGQAQIAPIAPATELPEGFRSGAPATTGVIRDAALAGIDGWRNAGYAKAEVGDQRIVANHRTSVLDADIELLPGRQLRFGKMGISGNEDVRPEAIEKIAGFPSGTVFDPQQVKKVGTRLRRTGAFSSVSLKQAEVANADGTLDYTADFIEQKKRRISFGVEVSSRTGMDLSTTWTHRNLFGAAERLQIEGRVRNIGGTEDVDGLFSIRLDRPATLRPDDNVFYLGEIEQLNKPHYSVLRGELGIGVRRVFSDDLWAELALKGSKSKADDAFGDDRQFNVLALPLRVEWDRRDLPISATRGFYLDANVTPFAGFSGSASGVSTYVDGRGYLSLTPSSAIVLAGRLQVGSILGAAQSEVSPEYLFYSGGAGTVRGQEYQSLGIAIGDDTAGGRSIVAASAEVRGRITEKISLVGFYDIGIVSSGSFVDGTSPSHSGAGLGIRYDVAGFGPLRLDLALPVTGPDDDGLQFYIGIGQAF